MRLAAFALLLVTGPVAAAPPPTITTRLRKPSRGFQLRLTPIEVPVGEREVCQAIRLPVDRPVDVDKMTVRMPRGTTLASHHFAMFLAQASAPGLPLDGPVDNVGCVGTGGQVVSPILAFVQRLGGDVVHFPKGVGVTLQPDQVLLFNAHYLNSGDAPVAVDVAVNFRKAKRGTVTRHARSFQLGTTRFAVPPGGEGATTAEWRTPFPMEVVWVSTHSHKFTESVDVEAVTAAGVVRPLVRTTFYAEPAFAYFSPPSLRLEPGDGVRWTCRYRNPTTRTIRFGVTSEDEMCFAVGFFVTDEDAAIPPLPPRPICYGGGLGLVCPLN